MKSLLPITLLSAALLINSSAENACGEPPSSVPADMVRIAGGSFTPIYKNKDQPQIEVAPFLLDIHPVTNADFLEFVRAHPKWQRSKVARLFADENYLSHWADDLDLGPERDHLAPAPVTRVSWFAARAYAAWKYCRLPTLAEWEFAGAAFTDSPDARDRPEYNDVILKWYGQTTPDIPAPVGSTFRNFYGVWDLHGLVWEWIEDFNSALVTGESREDGSLDRRRFCGAGALSATDARNYAAFMRYGFRSSLSAADTVANLGFRCARDLEPEIKNKP